MEDAGVILVFLTACVVLFLFSRSVADFVDKLNDIEDREENGEC